MGIFTGLFRSRDKPKNYYHSPSYAYWFGRSKSGAEVNPFTAMQQSAVYACIKVLAESVAQLPSGRNTAKSRQCSIRCTRCCMTSPIRK